MDVTVDVQVLMSASSLGDIANRGHSRVLLALMEAGPHCLVLDSEDLIRTQYERKMPDAQVAGRAWIVHMVLSNKVKRVKRAYISRGVREELRDVGIVGEDLNYYVRTAVASSDKRLVSHDSDYSSPACRLLKRRLSLTVHTAEVACASVS